MAAPVGAAKFVAGGGPKKIIAWNEDCNPNRPVSSTSNSTAPEFAMEQKQEIQAA
ncbi:hypothetical protein [Oricola sp.]|uniref:hypothetical protein n=1 Tax=Oricola sp. TaxID=1979950 RepID=UPI003BAC6350